MEKQGVKGKVLSILACAVLGGEITLLTDAVTVFSGGTMPLLLFAAEFAAATVLLCFVSRLKGKRVLRAAVILPLVLAVVAAAGFGCWRSFSAGAGYQDPDEGKQEIYGGRKVMVIVPHQDDDFNILGGVMEEYVRCGSELYAVFVTNGDYVGLTETRCREALAVFEHIGVPEDHVIFLGYGNEWAEGGPHIYNAESGTVMESHIGRTQTYGTAEHPAYREGREYTIDNLMEDLKSVILEYSPDVIFCSDYDHHIDHKATTLLFDKAMGQLLKETPGYTPVVYKAYAYGTAWEAEEDYYADNIRSTQNLFGEPYGQMPAVYRWEDRVRLPVDGATLSRSLVGSGAYETFGLYASQGTTFMAGRVINGDKVFWRRFTDSLCLGAEITASSGRAELLNDFMLIENENLTEESRMPNDGVWIPETGDGEKTVTVTLEAASDISEIVLYDHPSEKHNVLNAVIGLEDGTRLETGPLDSGGAATAVAVEGRNVTGFTVTLLETEGEQAGLTEVEAFADIPRQDGTFLKLMDGEGNFVYDYRTGIDGIAEFSVYTHGDLPEGEYVLSIDNANCSAVLEDGEIRVACPRGESAVLTVTRGSGQISDSVYIQNPGKLSRLWSELWQGVEEAVFARYSEKAYQNLVLWRTAEKAAYVIDHIG